MDLLQRFPNLVGQRVQIVSKLDYPFGRRCARRDASAKPRNASGNEIRSPNARVSHHIHINIRSWKALRVD